MYPKSFEEYKTILNIIDDTETVSKNYIKEVISDGYSSVEKNIADVVNEIIINRKLIKESNDTLMHYIYRQNEFIENSIKLISSNKCENMSLYTAFDEIKRNFIEKKKIYDELIKDSEKDDTDKMEEVLDFLSHSIRYYEIKYSANEKKYLNECFSILKDAEPTQLIRILQKIKTDIFTNDFENFYNVYKTVLKDLAKKSEQTKIKDLRTFIEQDRKYMSEIIDLLTSFELSFISFSENDTLSIKIISKSIVDMFNNSSESFKNIKMQEKVNLIDIKILSEEGFKRLIDKNGLSIVTEEQAFLNFSMFVGKINELLEQLKKCVFDYLVKNHDRPNAKDVLPEVSFAWDLIDIFEKINSYINNIPKQNLEFDKKASGIIQAIGQTINIKIDNIKENISVFEEEVINKSIDINEDLFYRIKGQIFLKLSDSEEGTFQRIEKVSTALLEETNEVDNDKIFVISDENMLTKELVKLKKDLILHEVSTFEEITSHSVLMLRTYDEDVIKNFATFMDSISYEIDELLSKNDIIKIRPDISSKFDSKEHVVLVAEKNEKFKKGEIIKIISSGFKENENVLIKASVVCAT